MITMVDHTVVNGISAAGQTTVLAPSGTATREQALIMATRFCSAFEGTSNNSSDTTDDSWKEPDLTLPQTEEEKMELVYGVGGQKYQTAEEAEANMVEISVPVWRLQEDGTKTSGTAYLQVNRNLASIYEAVFEEIYNGDEQFPIKDVGCYSWRTGEHSQGTAVDLSLIHICTLFKLGNQSLGRLCIGSTIVLGFHELGNRILGRSRGLLCSCLLYTSRCV